MSVFRNGFILGRSKRNQDDICTHSHGFVGWKKHKLESRLLDINNLRYANDTTLMAESEEELKSLLNMKEESEKVGLKLNMQKMKIMASGPITSWEIDAEQWKQCQTFFELQNHCRW